MLGLIKTVLKLFRPKRAEYMTDGWVIWKYDRKYAGTPRPRKGEGVKIDTDDWVKWCHANDKLMFYDSRIGRCYLKKELHQKKYIYWRAYKWTIHGKTPAKVHVGKLETISTMALRSKMRELIQKYEEKKARQTAEKERRRKLRERGRKRRWKRRQRKSRRSFACAW